MGLSTVGSKTLRDVINVVDITSVRAQVKSDDDTVVTAVPDKHRVNTMLKKAHTVRDHANVIESEPDSPMASRPKTEESEVWDSVHTFMVYTDAESVTGGRTYILQVIAAFTFQRSGVEKVWRAESWNVGRE